MVIIIYGFYGTKQNKCQLQFILNIHFAHVHTKNRTEFEAATTEKQQQAQRMFDVI